MTRSFRLILLLAIVGVFCVATFTFISRTNIVNANVCDASTQAQCGGCSPQSGPLGQIPNPDCTTQCWDGSFIYGDLYCDPNGLFCDATLGDVCGYACHMYSSCPPNPPPCDVGTSWYCETVGGVRDGMIGNTCSGAYFCDPTDCSPGCSGCSGGSRTCYNNSCSSYTTTSGCCSPNWVDSSGCNPTGTWMGGGTKTQSDGCGGTRTVSCCTSTSVVSTSSCSASCGNGSQTQTDNCGNTRSVSCCVGGCNYSCNFSGGCHTGTKSDPCGGTVTDTGTCPVCSPTATSCSPSNGACGPGTYTNTDCNCSITHPSCCVPGGSQDFCYNCANGNTTNNRRDLCGNISTSGFCTNEWFQAANADVLTNGTLTAGVIPATYSPTWPVGSSSQTAYFNYLVNPLSSSSYGIVSSSTNIYLTNSALASVVYCQTNPGNGAACGASAPSWVISNYTVAGSVTNLHLNNPQYNFDYFWGKYKDQICKTVVTTGDLSQSDVNCPGGTNGVVDVQPAAGTCSILQTTQIAISGANKSGVVFVEPGGSTCPGGLVTLHFTDTRAAPQGPGGVLIDNTNNGSNHGNSLIWIIKGNVLIDPNVTEVDGNWIVQGNWTESSNCSISSVSCNDAQLRILGSLAVYGNIVGGKHLSATTQPTRDIIYMPNFVNLINVIGESVYSWKEIAP